MLVGMSTTVLAYSGSFSFNIVWSVTGVTKHSLAAKNVTVSRYGTSSTDKATYTVELIKGLFATNFGEKTANGKTYSTKRPVSKGSYKVKVTKNKGKDIRVIGEGTIKQ